MKGSNSVAIVFCGMCYTREGTLTKADGGGLIEVTIEGKEVDFYTCRVCRLGVYAAFHRIMLASGVPEEETGYLEAVRELESLEEGGDVERLDETEDIDDIDDADDVDDVDQGDDDVDQEDDSQDIDDAIQDGDVDDDTSDDDAAAEAVIREVAENRPAPAPTGGTPIRDAAIVRNLSQAQKRAIRAWGRSQGMKVGERGPIPKEVIDAFFAHNAP